MLLLQLLLQLFPHSQLQQLTQPKKTFEKAMEAAAAKVDATTTKKTTVASLNRNPRRL
jgi:hypothetical protein